MYSTMAIKVSRFLNFFLLVFQIQQKALDSAKFKKMVSEEINYI